MARAPFLRLLGLAVEQRPSLQLACSRQLAGEENPIMPRRALRKLNLTDLYVRKLRPEAAAFVVWDTRQHGLALRVQPTGNRAWKAIYSRHGRPRWLHLGNADAIGLADARVLAAAAMLAVARGKDPAAEKKAERGKGTFEELATLCRGARQEA
jgi:hypothetical protein